MITRSPQETIEFGKTIAGHLKPNDVVALIGALGSGKTTLTKGIAKGLGVKCPDYVNSPSFVLIKEYKGKINLYHIDLYRLSNLSNIETLGLEEYFYSNGVSVIEWAERAEELLPREYLRIEVKILDGNSRYILIKGYGDRYKNISNEYEQRS